MQSIDIVPRARHGRKYVFLPRTSSRLVESVGERPYEQAGASVPGGPLSRRPPNWRGGVQTSAEHPDEASSLAGDRAPG